jgi:hypothetical protein
MSAARLTYSRDQWTVALRFPRFDAWAVAEIKRRIPADFRSYDPDHECWRVGIDWDQTAADILEAAFGSVVVEHAEDARNEPTPIRRTDPDFATLHLLPWAPPELVAEAHRTLARLHHPDVGGDPERMKRINLAYEKLRKAGVA